MPVLQNGVHQISGYLISVTKSFLIFFNSAWLFQATENILFFVEIGKTLALEYLVPDKRIRFMGIGSASAEGI